MTNKTSNNWGKVKLGDIGKVLMCKRVFKGETSNIGEIPFYKIGTFGNKPDAFISQELYDNYRKKFSFPKVGDVLLSASGTIGRKVVYDGKPAYFQDSNIIWLDHDESKVLNSFLFFLYDTIEWQTEGSTIKRLYNSILLNKTIPLPSLKEQSKIVDILSSIDEAIQKTDQIIQKSEELKSGLMNELLTQGIGHKKFNKTIYGEIPDDWSTQKLADLATITRGGSPRPIEEYITEDEDGFNWLRIGDIEIGAKYVTNTNQKIKRSGLSKTTLVHGGDFILSNSMSFGRPYIMKVDACIHDGWLAFKNIKDHLIIKEFLYYLLTSEKLQSDFRSIAAGSGVKNLKKESVSNIVVILPPLNEQQNIAEILSSVDQKVKNHQQLRFRLIQIKKGLMDDIFNHKVQIN